jgi:biotin synthase
VERLTEPEVEEWLRENDFRRLAELWRHSDEVRRRHVGDEVHFRGLIEISNFCVRECAYCGLRAQRRGLSRYRMRADEVVACARRAAQLGYGTVVMQSGEDPGLSADWVEETIRRVKSETGLAVTLSLGERSDAEFVRWREAGANRYLLRFETSDRTLYDRIHPPRDPQRPDRLVLLRVLHDIGYEVGSGVMVGIPGQTYGSVARDILLFRELDLDMIGIGPFIAHPETPLGQVAAGDDNVPSTELMVYKTMALTRLVCPEANIPSTTALATLNRTDGRELGLSRGANIVMPNLTPREYRALYEIYPGKACVQEAPEDCARCLSRRVEAMGRRIGSGPGSRRRAAEQT